MRTPLSAVALVLGLLAPSTPGWAAADGHGSASSAAVLAGVPVPTLKPPRLVGTPRLGRVLRAGAPRFAVPVDAVRWQWLRDDAPVPDATGRRYRLGPDDVGHRLRAQATASLAGYDDTAVVSRPTKPVAHRRDVRRTVRYSVATNGPVSADVGEFRRLAQQTYDHPRGWRAAGIRFVRVPRGGAFTLVLATPERLPTYSSVCSAQWSCRVGRNVVINQLRWQQASPAWNGAGGSLRDYRHMVVDHETGHWLGLGHAGCPAPGAPAPVMMQQSKGLDGCRFNPFPTLAELAQVS